MRRIEPGKRLQQEFSYQQEQLPTDKKIAQYVRQSTVRQTKHNRQSTAMQDEDLRKRLLKMGWKDADILKFDKDQGKSGQKTIDERVDMNDLYRRIGTCEVGAVACYDPSRLFRDLTRVQYITFVHQCEQHHIPIITWNQIYWTGNRRESQALIEKFEEAANYIDETVHGKLLPAKRRAIEEDKSHGGHAVPVGFVLAEEEIDHERTRKYYLPYEPHAELVRWLYRRYRELNGNLGRLLHELRSIGFMFPAFSGIKKIPHMGLPFDEQRKGYIIKTRDGLTSILTNPAYIGWYVYNGVVVSRQAHAPIVSHVDFAYARARLAPTDLNGEPNENKPQVNRRSYKTERKALLEGVIASDGLPVYAIASRGAYVARNNAGDHSTELVVPIARIDQAFAGAVRALLLHLEHRHEQGIEDSLYARLNELQQQQAEATVSFEKQLENLNKGIREAELARRVALQEEYEQGVREATQQLKRLHSARESLQAKTQQAESEEAQLEECKSLLDVALRRWDSLPFERQQRFVQLLVSKVNIHDATPHILRIDIIMHEPFNYTLYGHMFRQRGSMVPWEEAELETLKRLYKHADRLEILQSLPTRTWVSIVGQASLLHLQRATRRNSASGIHESLSYADALLMTQLYMDYGTDDVEWLISYPEPVISAEDEWLYTDIDALTSPLQNHCDSSSMPDRVLLLCSIFNLNAGVPG
jgi:hypothetical protein